MRDKRAVPGSQQYAYGIGGGIGDDQIRLAVGIKIARGDRLRILSGCILRRFEKLPGENERPSDK
jgi:hypothetical protein